MGDGHNGLRGRIALENVGFKKQEENEVVPAQNPITAV